VRQEFKGIIYRRDEMSIIKILAIVLIIAGVLGDLLFIVLP
jgi:hypothetical protein